MNSVYYQLELDRNIPVPLYYQLKQFMIENIENGKLKEGDAVPTEEELCGILNISRATIRQAFSELVNEGHLKRQKAKGTFIAKPKVEGRFFQVIESFNDEMKKKGLQPSSVVVDSGIMHDREVLEQLSLDGRSSCVYINRVRYANNDPMVYARTYLPAKPFKELLKVDLGKHSLYKTLEEKFGVVVHRVSRRLQVGLADGELSELLAIPEGSPIYVVYTLSYTKNGTPVEYSIAKYRGDLNEFRIDLERG
ncbi:GntR family transcriptional regulator [Christensenella tenuis]|jgi:GntR family transcriptional regulator|uniref:GntR family transcriptional regulator n=1 Tax=Christensenella tenuis TaxID=2763033 RepID=A0ABR7EB15_9FIRM|nr:GntR family transcriptional regulator [Christensenella tenuis]MBC5646940.1 GntR family transcriptional regulator [Christensenella tenuis]